MPDRGEAGLQEDTSGEGHLFLLPRAVSGRLLKGTELRNCGVAVHTLLWGQETKCRVNRVETAPQPNVSARVYLSLGLSMRESHAAI